MGERSTRNALVELGKSASEEQLIEAGKKVLRDGIREYLASKGLSEAVGFEVKLKNGEEFTVLSDENPKLDTDMEEVASIDVKQSAKAGNGAVEALLIGNVATITLVF